LDIKKTLVRVLAVSIAALLLAGCGSEAKEARLAPEAVDDAYRVMLTTSQAQELGVGKHSVVGFSMQSATKGSPDDPYFCELTGGIRIEGQGAGSILESEFESLGGEALSEVRQEIHWYANEKSAKKAYNDIVKKVKTCVGEQLGDASDVSGETTNPAPTMLTNGTKKSAKLDHSFLWINSETIDSDAKVTFSDYDYTTVRTFGNFIQIIEIQSEGLDATPFTKKQIATLDEMTGSLGNAWQAEFM